MADARAAVEMLTTDDPDRAAELASQLDKHNRQRRDIQHQGTDEARDRIERSPELSQAPCIVVSHPDWHPGVVGLIANRIAEEYWRPAFVFSEKDGTARGSARSIPGFHLFDAVSECEDLLDRFGGHEGAAGLSLPLNKLNDFRERICRIADRELSPEKAVPHLELEGEVELSSLSLSVIKEMRRLAPFGEWNPSPLFCARDLELVGNPQIVGSRRNHLSFLVRQNDTTLKVIAFRKADWLEEIREHEEEPLHLAFEPRINNYRGRNSVELRAEDLQWAGEEDIEKL
jgi:single-stranded-DNA-specific exonuclease